MKAAASLFLTCLLLSFALIWQAGCNPDLGLQDPLRPRADVQVTGFTPTILSPTEVRTGGTETLVSADGTTRTTRPITKVTFQRPGVQFRVTNGVSCLITGYSVVYTFARPGNPSTGLALFGGPLNIFLDAAPVTSGNGLASGTGIAAGGQDSGSTQTAATGGSGAAGTGTGISSFQVEVLSKEAQDFLFPKTGTPNPNLLACNITFFVEDINGHTFTVPARVSATSIVVIATEGQASGGAGGGAGGGTGAAAGTAPAGGTAGR